MQIDLEVKEGEKAWGPEGNIQLSVERESVVPIIYFEVSQIVHL